MTQTPPNRATRRASLKTSKSRHRANKLDVFTLRQQRIERERDERERTSELIERRKNAALDAMEMEIKLNMKGWDENVEDGGNQLRMVTWMKSILRRIREGDVKVEWTWYVPSLGFLLGVVGSAIWRNTMLGYLDLETESPVTS